MWYWIFGPTVIPNEIVLVLSIGRTLCAFIKYLRALLCCVVNIRCGARAPNCTSSALRFIVTNHISKINYLERTTEENKWTLVRILFKFCFFFLFSFSFWNNNEKVMCAIYIGHCFIFECVCDLSASPRMFCARKLKTIWNIGWSWTWFETKMKDNEFVVSEERRHRISKQMQVFLYIECAGETI